MPTTANAWSASAIDGFDFYLIVLDRLAQGLVYGTYYGGGLSREHVDGGTSRFDANGIVYQSVCAGCQNNDDFPCFPNNAWSCDNLSSGCNNGVFKFDFEITPKADFTVSATSGCAPLTITFVNNSINNTNFLWDFGNGDTTSIQLTPTRTFTDTGTYYVYLTIEDSLCALVDTALQIITVFPELSLNTSNDTVICDTSTLNIWASASGHDGNYVWSSNPQFSDTLNSSLDSLLTITVLTPGYYYVSVSNPDCNLTDSVLIDFSSNNINLPQGIDLCQGESINILASTGNPIDPIIDYDWSPDSIIISGDGTNNITVNPTTSQYIYLTAISTNGCIINDSVYITVTPVPPPITAFVDLDTVAFGSSTGVHVTPMNLTYQWQPAADLSNPNGSNPIATPSKIGANYYIVPTGCETPDIFIPNAFTPNRDGNNDLFKVRTINLTEITLRVYDRWGEKVFETNNINAGWDGTYKGKDLDPDVYVYYLTALCLDDQAFFQKGNVTLIR